MNRRILTAALAIGAAAFGIGTADAALVAAPADTFTVGSAGTFTFTYLGFSAADTDIMHFVFNGQALFTNTASSVGSQVTVDVTAAGTYALSLENTSVGLLWSSNPALNPDGSHLATSMTFGDFGIAGVPSVSGPYFGWEDLPVGLTPDFNDLVFAATFKPFTVPAPEPASLAMLGAGLLGLGLVRRRGRV